MPQTDARALHADSRIHTKEGAVLVEIILLVKNLLTVIATDFALQIIVSIIDDAIRITFDIHAIIRVLSSIRIFSSAFYPPSAFSYPRFIRHPHFLIRIFSSAIRIRHPYPRFIPTPSLKLLLAKHRKAKFAGKSLRACTIFAQRRPKSPLFARMRQISTWKIKRRSMILYTSAFVPD